MSSAKISFSTLKKDIFKRYGDKEILISQLKIRYILTL